VQAVGNESHGAEQAAADNLGRHHRAAQRDDAPRLAFVLLVVFA
jgi:hypothetical protein